MDKSRDKVYRRKVSFTESQTKVGKGSESGRKEGQRPRSRSVYTTNSYISDDAQTLREVSKYEGTQWIPRAVSSKNIYIDDYTDTWHDDPIIGGTTVSPHGVISLRLRDRIRVDISIDKAVRIVNYKNGIILALNHSGSSSALLHPNGRVFQYGSRVEILAHDAQGNNKYTNNITAKDKANKAVLRYAKMWYKGVSFTSDQCALVYLVDSAGTRTTTDTFSDLSGDFSLGVFYNDGPMSTDPNNHGPHIVNEAIGLIQAANYWITEDGTDNWIINNVRITQTADGLVRVGRNSNKFSLRTSPGNGSASVSSPFLHCTGSMGQTRHLFVRRGERRMHYDGASFIVRNAGHSAGFDDKHQLKVY